MSLLRELDTSIGEPIAAETERGAGSGSPQGFRFAAALVRCSTSSQTDLQRHESTVPPCTRASCRTLHTTPMDRLLHSHTACRRCESSQCSTAECVNHGTTGRVVLSGCRSSSRSFLIVSYCFIANAGRIPLASLPVIITFASLHTLAQNSIASQSFAKCIPSFFCCDVKLSAIPSSSANGLW
jgi:hypothetical protein